MKQLYTFKGKIGEETFDFGLKKPNRSEMEDLEIFQAAIKSKLMNMGVQTKAAVDKYYMDNCDGAMTKGDEYEITKLRQKLVRKEEDLLTSTGDENKDTRIKLYEEINKLSDQIRNFNEYYSAIYDDTVETKARNKSIDYAFLNFSLIDEKAMFESDNEHPQKRMIEQFQQMEEKQDGENGGEWSEIYNKLVFLFTLWFMGIAETEEEFEGFYKESFGKKIETEIEEEEIEKEVVEEVKAESEEKKAKKKVKKDSKK